MLSKSRLSNCRDLIPVPVPKYNERNTSQILATTKPNIYVAVYRYCMCGVKFTKPLWLLEDCSQSVEEKWFAAYLSAGNSEEAESSVGFNQKRLLT